MLAVIYVFHVGSLTRVAHSEVSVVVKLSGMDAYARVLTA